MGYSDPCQPVGAPVAAAALWTSTGAILVLFILLVIITRTILI